VASGHLTWIGLAYLLVPSVIALLAAVVGLINHKALQTGEASGGKSIGLVAAQVSHALQTGNDKTPGEMITELHGESSAQQTPYETHGPKPATGP